MNDLTYRHRVDTTPMIPRAQMREHEDFESPACDMDTLRPAGSPSWASRFPFESVLSDAHESSLAPTENPHPPPSRTPSPLRSYSNVPAPRHPIDIFRTNPNRPAQKNKLRTPAKITARDAARLALEIPELRQIAVASESLKTRLRSLGILAGQCRQPAPRSNHPLGCRKSSWVEDAKELPALHRPKTRQQEANKEALKEKWTSRVHSGPDRLAMRTDHPLECDTPLIADEEGLDFASKVRSALRRRKPIPRYEVPTVKSVRFDPAVLALEFERPIVKPVVAEAVTKSEPAVRIEDPGTNEKHEMGFGKCLEAVLTLEKQDRIKLRKVIDALNSEIDESRPTAHGSSKTTRRLNPRAREFCGSDNSSTFSGNVNDAHLEWSFPSGHSHAHRPYGDVNYVQLGRSMLPPLQSNVHFPNLPPIWVHTPNPIHLPTQPVEPIFQRPIQVRTPIPIVHPLPLSDSGHGREAKIEAVPGDWGKSLLKRFKAEYPMTGKFKAAPPAESKKKLATAIQQRLEFVLMQEREKKGAAQMFKGERKENMCPTREE